MRIRQSTLTADELRKQLDYDPLTGIFTYRINQRYKKAGMVAGRISNHGGVTITICGQDHQAHRLAWLWYYGKWPDNEVDHLDGDRANNRIANLRDCTRAINMQNQRRPQKGIARKYLCVYPTKKKCGMRYRAIIQVDGKPKHLGYFDTEDEAYAAYLDAKRRFHPGCTI